MHSIVLRIVSLPWDALVKKKLNARVCINRFIFAIYLVLKYRGNLTCISKAPIHILYFGMQIKLNNLPLLHLGIWLYESL